MNGSTLFISYLIILLKINLTQVHAESVLNWIWGKQEESSTFLVADGVPLISVPYETLTEDEKFLKEAAKFVTDIQISSPLEICQHKVVLKIKTACASMTEEQLAKLSVNLLNCQSATEGRRLFPCTDKMSIKECTTHMDADTWNAYHLISNRARAVCYSARSHQFRALTELTVNKLMQSAQSQIKTLASLKESQDRLEEQTIAAHKIIQLNIQDLTDEKALIRAGHSQLAIMTEDIQTKLEKASRDFVQQAMDRNENHQEILSDLKNIQIQTQLLWEKIENSTNRIIKQNEETISQYEKTLTKIEKINETIIFVWNLTNIMRSEIDHKLKWITEYIGATGENLEKIYRISLHILYLFATMIAAAFLQAPLLTRTAILGIVPINLISYLKHGLNASIDFISLTFLLLLITAMHYVMNFIQYILRSNNKIINTDKKKDTSLLNNKKLFAESLKKNNHFKYGMQNTSLKLKILQTAINLWQLRKFVFNPNVTIKADKKKYLPEKLKTTYHLMKSRMSEKFEPIEELSCSYISAKRYNEFIISSEKYPSLSEDSSDGSGSPNSRKFILSDNNSATGAVLKSRKEKTYVSPLSAFFKENGKRIHEQRSVTPESREVCEAKTRSGNPCRLLAYKGKKYCFRHASSLIESE